MTDYKFFTLGDFRKATEGKPDDTPLVVYNQDSSIWCGQEDQSSVEVEVRQPTEADMRDLSYNVETVFLYGAH